MEMGRASNPLPELVTDSSSVLAKPGQSVYPGGAVVGRDLIASICFLLECSGVPAGLRVVLGSLYMGQVTE